MSKPAAAAAMLKPLSVIPEEGSAAKERNDDNDDDDLDVAEVIRRVESVRRKIREIQLAGAGRGEQGGAGEADEAEGLSPDRLRIRQRVEELCRQMEREIAAKVDREMEQRRRERRAQQQRTHQQATLKDLRAKAEDVRRALREQLEVKIGMEVKEAEKEQVKRAEKKVIPRRRGKEKAGPAQAQVQAKPFPRKLLSAVYSKMQKEARSEANNPSEEESSSSSYSSSSSSAAEEEPEEEATEPKKNSAPKPGPSSSKRVGATSSLRRPAPTRSSTSTLDTLDIVPPFPSSRDPAGRANCAIVHVRHSPKPVRRAIVHLSRNSLGGVDIMPTASISDGIEPGDAVSCRRPVSVLKVVHLEEEEEKSDNEKTGQSIMAKPDAAALSIASDRHSLSPAPTAHKEAAGGEDSVDYSPGGGQSAITSAAPQIAIKTDDDPPQSLGLCSELDLSSVSEARSPSPSPARAMSPVSAGAMSPVSAGAKSPVYAEAKSPVSTGAKSPASEEFEVYSDQFEASAASSSSNPGRLSTITEATEQSRSESTTKQEVGKEKKEKKEVSFEIPKDQESEAGDMKNAPKSSVLSPEAPFSPVSETDFLQPNTPPKPSLRPIPESHGHDSTLDVSEGAFSLSESSFEDTPRNAKLFEETVDEGDAIHRRFNSAGSRIALFAMGAEEAEQQQQQQESPPSEMEVEESVAPPTAADDTSAMEFESMTEGEELSDGQLLAPGTIRGPMSEGEVSVMGKPLSSSEESGHGAPLELEPNLDADTSSSNPADCLSKSEGEVNVPEA